MATVVTVTVASSGGDYTSLSAAEAGEQRDLVAADEQCVIECEAFTDTTSVYLSGWTADATRNIIVRGVGDYILAPSSAVEYVFRIEVQYTEIRDIGIQQNFATGGNRTCFNLLNATDFVLIERCKGVIAGSGTGTQFSFLAQTIGADSSDLVVRNCFFDSSGHTGSTYFSSVGRATYPNSNHEFANITCIDTSGMFFFLAGSSGDNPPTVTNVVIEGATGIESGYTGSAITYVDCVTDVGSPPSGWTSGLTSADFFDYAGGIYRPAEGSLLDSAGTNLSADFTTDLSGVHRRFWSIGAFDYWALYARVVASPAESDEYSSLSAAEAAEQKSLTAVNAAQVIECEAFTDTTLCIFDGWTTGVGNDVIIRAAAGHEHNGVPGTGYVITQGAIAETLEILIDNATVSGIEIINTVTGIANVADSLHTDLVDNLLLENLIVESNNTRSSAVFIQNAGTNTVIRNVLAIHNGERNAVRLNLPGSDRVELYNVTAIHTNASNTYNCFINANSGSTLTTKNCVGYSAGSGDVFESDMLDGVASNNASSDSSATGTGAVTGITTAAFVDYAGGDYTPAASGALDGAGVDLSADFTDDITGATRTVPWDIGAFIAAVDGGGGGGSAPVLSAINVTSITFDSITPNVTLTF